MSSPAQVRSIDALVQWRARLILYLSKAKPLLDDTSSEVTRTREWIRQDRRVFWENEVRRRTRQLENAEQALFSARSAHLREATSAELAAVQRAKRLLAEAEEKVRVIKRWSLGFDEQAGPLLKQVEQLRGLVAGDLARGVDFLDRLIATLESYAEARPAARD